MTKGAGTGSVSTLNTRRHHAMTDLATEAMTFFTASNGWQVAIHESDHGPYLVGASEEGGRARTPYVNLANWQVEVIAAGIPKVKDLLARGWLTAMCEFYRQVLSEDGGEW